MYEVYATEPDKSFWRELAKCNREEFEKSGTNGKCIEARELMIALPESFIHYDHDYLLKKMEDDLKKRYGVECFAALHHNKRKTNLHIHMIFAERKRLEQPTEKFATRNMFYDEQGKHVRTKKEILGEDGNIRKDCKIIKKGEVYERKIFTTKEGCFKQESFLDEAKVFYTDLINQMVFDDIETEIRIHEKEEPVHQREKEKIPFPVNTHRKLGTQDKAEQPQQENTTTIKKSIARQIKAEKESVTVETKKLGTERPPQPKPSVLAAKYPRLKEINDRLKDRNKAIFEREKKCDKLKKELSECMGIFKSGRRKELQQEIDMVEKQISNMKKRLSAIVREYKFDSVQAFYKEFNAARKEDIDYRAAHAEWEKIYGDKAENSMSIKEKLRQKERIVKEREADRVHQAWQKDKGAR